MTPVTADATARLHRTISDILGIDAASLTDDASPDTISTWDSLNHLNLVMALESEFGLSLSPEDALDMRTIGLIRTILRERGVDLP